jgi:hypothetical protein
VKILLSAAIIFALVSGCSAQPVTTTTPPTSSQYQLEYRLISHFDNIFWNDPDFYPISREGQEQTNALEQFAGIRENELAFSAIIEYLRLDRKDTYTIEEKLLIYRQYKLLTLAVQMAPASGGTYRFVLRVGEGQGERIEGTVTAAGSITVEKREASFNTHPICLAKGTLIDTPLGEVPVEAITAGMTVWTVDPVGNRVAVEVLRTRVTAVPASFRVVILSLDDGRTIQASPGHPSAEGRPLGDYRVGDSLDHGVVAKAELVVYQDTETYDILPAGGSALYWAGRILLRSTIAY